MSNITIRDNSDALLREIENKKTAILEAIGLQAEANAKLLCPVDTGRARNSITHTVSGNSAFEYQYKDNKGNEFTETIPAVPKENNAVYIGSNVSYFKYLETGTSKIQPCHMLRNAISDHKDEYKQIAENILKSSS